MKVIGHKAIGANVNDILSPINTGYFRQGSTLTLKMDRTSAVASVEKSKKTLAVILGSKDITLLGSAVVDVIEFARGKDNISSHCEYGIRGDFFRQGR